MKQTLAKLEEALSSLYAFELRHRANDFLVDVMPVGSEAVRSGQDAGGMSGALLVHHPDDLHGGDVNLGVFLSQSLKDQLPSLGSDPRRWTLNQTNAFAIASEEVSHFQYYVFHASSGRSLSQLELEIQGELDKFLLLYFTKLNGKSFDEALFNDTFDQLFEGFSLKEGLSPVQTERYELANRLSKRAIRRLKTALQSKAGLPEALQQLRRLYRLGGGEKISFLNRG